MLVPNEEMADYGRSAGTNSFSIRMKGPQVTVGATASVDDERLAELGYRGEFKREFSLIETVAFAFSIMAVIGGVSSTLSFGLASGGHIGMVWGWFIPCLFILCIAASMAELASSMPTSAGLYYFSAKLAPERYSALASWITGWANVTGQITLVCSIDYTVFAALHITASTRLHTLTEHESAQMITTAIAVGTDGTVVLGAGPTYGILVAILVVHGVICSAATRILARMNLFYGILTAGATVAAIVALFVCSGHRKVSTQVAFTSFENNTGWSNDGWAFLLAFAAPMWSLTGYDSAAHISEEVSGAAHAAPIAILVSVAAVGGMGWILIIAVSFATASVPDLLQTKLALPMGQLLLDVLGKRGMMAIWSFTIIAQFLCGAAQGVDASRVVFAFARDNALPGSRWWKRINKHTQTPVNAVWLVIILSVFCGLLVFSATAFSSLAGASVIGLYTSYATPIFLRITSGRNKLVPGPFSLGKWYMPVGIVAVTWVAFIVILLCFPPSQRTDAAEMNYAPVIVIAVFIFAAGSWMASARNWFVGPLPNIGAVCY